MKGHGKQEENSMTSKTGPGKFVTSKVRVAHNSVSQVSNMPGAGAAGAPATTQQPINNLTTATGGSGLSPSAVTNPPNTESSQKKTLSDKDIQLELDRISQTLQLLKERGSSEVGNNASMAAIPGLAEKIAAIQEALKSAAASSNDSKIFRI